MNPETIFSAYHQSSTSQIGEMTGDRRLRQVQSIVKMADTDLSVRPREDIQKPQPDWIGEGFEKLHRLFKHVGSVRLILYPHNRIYREYIEVGQAPWLKMRIKKLESFF